MHPIRCTTLTADGRRCTSLVYPGHTMLCHQHLRQQLDGSPPSDDVAADILQSIQNFQSAASINAALGKILTMLAAGRIKRQDALSMAYICQLLLQSLKEFKHEIRLTTYEKFFQRDLLKVLNARTPLEEFVYPPPPPEPEAKPEAEPESEQLVSENPQRYHSDSAPPANQEPTPSDQNQEQPSPLAEVETDEQPVNELKESDQSEETEELETEKMEV